LEVASNAPLRDGGVTLYEGGIRVPCVVRWPARIKPGTVCREPLVQMDFFVLAAKLAGAPLPQDRVIDGRDPAKALAGIGPSPHEFLLFQYRDWSAVRHGQYKLVRQGRRPFELYDLSGDIGETTDLAAQRPEVVRELQARFDRWLRSVAN
jgi:arylsulfatase A-like enzyme